MKKFLALFALAVLLPACNCKKTETWCEGGVCQTKVTEEKDDKVVSQVEYTTPEEPAYTMPVPVQEGMSADSHHMEHPAHAEHPGA